MTKRRVLWIVAIIVLLPLLLVGGLVLAVQSDWMERKVEQMVSAKLEREVQLDGISLKPGWPFLVTIAHLRIGNPQWAEPKDLVDAEGLYARVAVPPLLRGLIVVPYIGARHANAGLEMDGKRATWRFGKESDQPSKLYLGLVYMDDGHIVFIDKPDKTNLKVEVKGTAGEAGDLRATGEGTYKGQPAKATVRVPHLDPQHESPLTLAGEATVGRTHGSAEGTFTTDAKELDLQLKLAGQTFKDLNDLTGMLLPDSPPYNLGGRLRHVKDDWIFDPFQGKVGVSDLRGALTYGKGGQRPFLRANLKSKLLDIGDLGPVVHAPPRISAGHPASPEQQQKAEEIKASDRVLPDEKFNTGAWGRMDADVTLDAQRIQRPKQLPLESLAAHLILKDGVLTLDPLRFGMAGGHFTSRVVLDGNRKPMRGDIRSDVQGLQLAKLFPTSKTMEEAVGTLYGHIELKGAGDSVAALMGTSTGQASFAVGGGRVSKLMLELVDLHVPEIVMLLGKKYEQSNLNCAVSTLNVNDGVAKIDSFVIDTEESEIRVEGNLSLKDETVNLKANPYAKHPTLISLRSPIIIKGPFKKPKGYPEPVHIAVRAGAAVALGAIAPPLALLALMDTAKGKDQDCAKYLAEAKARGATRKQ